MYIKQKNEDYLKCSNITIGLHIIESENSHLSSLSNSCAVKIANCQHESIGL